MGLVLMWKIQYKENYLQILLFTNFNGHDNCLNNEAVNKNRQRHIRQDNCGLFL